MKKINLILIILLYTINIHAQLNCREGLRYIEDENGEPFFWLGDTAWELFHVLDKEEACYYLENRQKKGFTVIQAVLLSEMDGLDRANAYGDLPLKDRNPAQPNENYFRHVDFIVGEAEKRGLYMGILPTWGSYVVTTEKTPPIFNKENAYQYGLFLGKRYKGRKIIWILGGDRNVNNEKEWEVWNAMADGLTHGNGERQLISYHPTGDISSHYWFHNEPWLSFNIVQSGHYRKFDTVYRYGGMYAQVNPQKPFVNAEPAYEDIGIRFWEYTDFEKFGKKKEEVIGEDGLIKDKTFYPLGFYTDYDVRMQAYWTFLSGAAGYTYGNNAIWQMYKPGGKYVIPCLTYWKEALDRPGAEQMQFVKKLFTEYPLDSFSPDQSVVHGLNLMNENHITAVRGNNGNFIIAYMNKGQAVKIDLRKLSGSGNSYWFNPRNGTKGHIGKFHNQGIKEFCLPANKQANENDWVLILDVE